MCVWVGVCVFMQHVCMYVSLWFCFCLSNYFTTSIHDNSVLPLTTMVHIHSVWHVFSNGLRWPAAVLCAKQNLKHSSMTWRQATTTKWWAYIHTFCKNKELTIMGDCYREPILCFVVKGARTYRIINERDQPAAKECNRKAKTRKTFLCVREWDFNCIGPFYYTCSKK